MTLWLFIWAYNAIDPGSNWDADREGVGLLLIRNKQANLHYSRDIFPWGAKREKKPDRIWRALQHMASRRGVHASWVQLSRGALREGSGGDKTYTATAVIVAVVLFCCWICLLLTLFQLWCRPRLKPGPLERVWQLQIGTVSMLLCVRALNMHLNKSVSYFSPQLICLF